MYVSDDESSGRLDWGTYPNGYNGIIKQNAKFGFTDLVWNGNSIPLNDDGACAGGNSCPDFHVIETSQTNTIITGCMQQSYCNTNNTANWPTDPTDNPCAGTPGCQTYGKCNYNANADCSAPCTSPIVMHFYTGISTCNPPSNPPCENCYSTSNCSGNYNACHGTLYNSQNACQTANMSGCTDPTACNEDSCAVVDDGSCYYGTVTTYYDGTCCAAGPSCNPGNLGTAYTDQSVCCNAVGNETCCN